MAVLREQRLNAARLLLAGRPGSVASTGAAAAARDEQQGGEDQPGGPDLGGHAPHLFRCGMPQSTAGSRTSPRLCCTPPPSSAPSTAITPRRLMAITSTAGGQAPGLPPGSNGSRNGTGNGCSPAMNGTLN